MGIKIFSVFFFFFRWKHHLCLVRAWRARRWRAAQTSLSFRRGKGLSGLTGLRSEAVGSQTCEANQVAGYSAPSNTLRYQSRALTHLCQNQLVKGRERGGENTRPLFKIHKLTWKWQGLLCAQIFPSSVVASFQALLEGCRYSTCFPSILSSFSLWHHIASCYMLQHIFPLQAVIELLWEMSWAMECINNAGKHRAFLSLPPYILFYNWERRFERRVMSVWLPKDINATFRWRWSDGVKTWRLVIALSLLLLFLIFPSCCLWSQLTLLAIKEQFLYCWLSHSKWLSPLSALHSNWGSSCGSI